LKWLKKKKKEETGLLMGTEVIATAVNTLEYDIDVWVGARTTVNPQSRML
jgi:hypothetical protein